MSNLIANETAFPVAKVRAALPVLEKIIYLNTGTMGIAAAPVVEATLAATRALESEGLVAAPQIHRQQEKARAKLAAFLGTDASEISLTGNATDGITLVASGLAALRGSWLHPGDTVLISSQEHPAMTLPWRYMEMVSGIKVETFEVSTDPAETLAHVEAAITPQTRVISTSHVTCQTGTRIPVNEICALARDRGILTLIDGAQALGQFRVNVREIGCDFYAGNGHKWLHGPKGTGVLYIRRESLDFVQPVLTGAGAANFPNWPDLNTMELAAGGRRFEFATRNESIWTGMAAALDWLEQLGWAAVEERIAALTLRFKTGLVEIPGVEMLSPREWAHSSGLVSCRIAGQGPRDLARKLMEVQPLPIRTRVVDEMNAIRFALAYFITEDEVDRALEVLRTL